MLIKSPRHACMFLQTLVSEPRPDELPWYGPSFGEEPEVPEKQNHSREQQKWAPKVSNEKKNLVV